MEAIKEYKCRNLTLKIYQDENPQSPREWDNLGRMICSHSRYNLGDKYTINPNDYNSIDEVEKAIIKREDARIILPLYLYDHSGITISTTPFSCRWDSGKVGYIVASKKAIRENFGIKKITRKIIEKTIEVLKGEVETYNQYLIGDVYGYRIFEDEEEIESCWGFFGSDIMTNGMLGYIGEKEFVEIIEKDLAV